MLFAQTTNGIMVSTIMVVTILSGAGGVIAFLFRALIVSKDKEFALMVEQKDAAIKELDGMKKSYQEIALEALKSATDTTNYWRQKENKPPLLLLPAVISESHSPSTEKQREVAAIQTMRARMAQIKAATGQEPRTEPEHSKED